MMPSFTLGPRMGMFLSMFAVMISFAAGAYFGAKTNIVNSLENEVTVLFDDSRIANEIRSERIKSIKEVEASIDEIEATDDCAVRTMGDILQLQSDFD